MCNFGNKERLNKSHLALGTQVPVTPDSSFLVSPIFFKILSSVISLN